MFYSPLRYPGGKNKLSPFIAKVCLDNRIDGHYIEPYSGGAAVALFLLFEGVVKKVTLNDKDKSIYAFWHCVLHETHNLCELILKTELTVNEWRIQREVQKNKHKVSLLELGFSTLFLNRTNHSGIINGGVLGGVNQDGKYLIDCRFNKEEIIKRIEKIANKKNVINIFNEDAVELIKKEVSLNNKNTIIYFDPPYYLKANSLYMNHYKKNNHKEVSLKIKEIKNIQWIVSYDNVPEIQILYSDCPRKDYSFKHVAYRTRIGKEVLFFSPSLILPEIKDWDPLKFKLKKTNNSKKIIYKKCRTRDAQDNNTSPTYIY